MIARLQDRLGAALLRLLPTAALAGGMVGMLAYSVDQAGWVKDNSPIISLLFMGTLVGWMLAVSRWRGWMVALVAVFLGLVGAVQALARVAPWIADWYQVGLAGVLDGMHLRLVTFQLRAGGWLGAIQNGGSVRDTGLFVMVISIAGWASAVWLMWWLVRRNQALPGVLPMLALMAVNAHLSRQPRIGLLVFCTLVILAAARSSYTALHKDWVRRRVDYSEDLGVEWVAMGSLAVMAIVTFAWLFSILGTPDGWKAASDLVEKSRQQMNNTANQVFGGVKPPPPQPSGEKALPPPASVNTPNLGEIGSPLAQGDQTILWVGLSDPPPIPVEVSGPQRGVGEVIRHYWRSSIFGGYNGRGWEAAGFDPQPAYSRLSDENMSGRYLLKQHFEVTAIHDQGLFAVNDPIEVSGYLDIQRSIPDGSRLVVGTSSIYDVTSLATAVTVQQMEAAPDQYPADIQAYYLQLPEALPSRVRRLAGEIAGSGANSYQKAIKIQQYLRETYEYDLAVPPAPAGKDVVDYFLFDASGGFCTYYASAMVVMLRVEGIPARVAAGYAMGGYDPSKGMYRVPASASHAWVEVYFAGLGWVEFEPTPAYPQFAYAAGASTGMAGPLPANGEKKPPPLRGPSQLWWLLLPVGVVVLLWGMYIWSRAERLRLSQPGAMALVLYRRVRKGLALAGVPLSPTLTAAEYIAEVEPNLGEYPHLTEVLRQATQLFEQAAYSPRPPRVEDVTEGEWMWGQARGELFSLLVRVRFRISAGKSRF